MKIKYILAVAIVAMLAIPGTASQLAARSMSASAGASATTGAAFADPDMAPTLSITLPTAFHAADIDGHPRQGFN